MRRRQLIRGGGLVLVSGIAGCTGGSNEGGKRVDVPECESPPTLSTRQKEDYFTLAFANDYPYETPLMVYKNGEEMKRVDEVTYAMPIRVEPVSSGDTIQYVVTREDDSECEVFSTVIE